MGQKNSKDHETRFGTPDFSSYIVHWLVFLIDYAMQLLTALGLSYYK
jgi:hypothetical protein